jgi:hypothetical protein
VFLFEALAKKMCRFSGRNPQQDARLLLLSPSSQAKSASSYWAWGGVVTERLLKTHRRRILKPAGVKKGDTAGKPQSQYPQASLGLCRMLSPAHWLGFGKHYSRECYYYRGYSRLRLRRGAAVWLGVARRRQAAWRASLINAYRRPAGRLFLRKGRFCLIL